MIRQFKPVALLAVIISASLGCAKISQVSTNLDRENFKDYFSAGKVKIYQSEKEFTGRYRFVGLVEGESCQQAAHQELPNELDARTAARRHAFAQNANGIIFSQCVLIKNDQASSQCIATRVCYGRAYQVESADD